MYFFVWTIWGLFSIVSIGSSHKTKTQFAGDYFSNRIVFQVVSFGCWDPIDSADFSRTLMNRGIKVSYVAIRKGLELKRILKINYYKLGIFLDSDCPQSESIFRQFSEQLRFNESYWWLIVTGQKSIPKEFFSKLPLNIATEMTVALREKDSYELYDVYNPSYNHGARLNVTLMGRWNFGDGLKVELTQYKYKRRGNLYGLTLNSSVALDHPPDSDIIKYLTTPTDPGFDTMHRFNYGLIVQLQAYYNFTINLKRGTTWGYLLPNGSYNGILGDMSRGLVDISVTPFQYKIDRLDVVEYTVQTWIAKVCLIFRHPQNNELSNVFLKPFKFAVWLYIVVFGFVNWFVLYFTVKIEQHYDAQKTTNSLDTNPASEVGLVAIAAICQQGVSDGPRIYSGRIVFLFLFLWALLTFQFYSASVVGSLLVEKTRYIITPKDILESSLAVGADDVAYNHDFFATSEDPVVGKIYNKKMAIDKKLKKRPFFKPEEGLKMVKKGGFAFHVDLAIAYKIIEETFEENEICELQEIYLIPPKHTSVGVVRYSPFKKMVTYGMRQIIEHGTITRLRNIWSHRRPQCPESHNSTPVPVAIEEFSSALFILVFGYGFSLIVMFIEKLTTRFLSADNQTEMRQNSNPEVNKSVTDL